MKRIAGSAAVQSMALVSMIRSATAWLDRMKAWWRPGVVSILALACAPDQTSAAVEQDQEAVEVRLSAGGQYYWAEQVIDGLDLPSSMVWLPEIRRDIVAFLRMSSEKSVDH